MRVFAPMPSASDNAAMMVNPGFFTSIRKPYMMSCHVLVIESRVLTLPLLALDDPGSEKFRS
jgi:hypothetical protein